MRGGFNVVDTSQKIPVIIPNDYSNIQICFGVTSMLSVRLNLLSSLFLFFPFFSRLLMVMHLLWDRDLLELL